MVAIYPVFLGVIVRIKVNSSLQLKGKASTFNWRGWHFFFEHKACGPLTWVRAYNLDFCWEITSFVSLSKAFKFIETADYNAFTADRWPLGPLNSENSNLSLSCHFIFLVNHTKIFLLTMDFIQSCFIISETTAKFNISRSTTPKIWALVLQKILWFIQHYLT